MVIYLITYNIEKYFRCAKWWNTLPSRIPTQTNLGFTDGLQASLKYIAKVKN